MRKMKKGIYRVRSICDSDCIFEFELLDRTDKTAIIKHPHKGMATKRCKIMHDTETGNEFIYPLGRYSMAPTISLNHCVETKK